MKKIITLITAIVSLMVMAKAQPNISFSTFSTGYNFPVDIENCKDSRLFIVERLGKISICDSNGVRNPTPFLNITSQVLSGYQEEGLLGVAFHPHYKQNGYFYVDYTTGASPGYTHISRFSVNPADSNQALAGSELLLLSIKQPYQNHNGGCVKFGPDGYLYISMGDGGSAGDPQNRAQNKDSLLGKILRIDVDHPQSPLNYGIPADNPFANTAGRDEIWSYGNRNPWRYSFDRIYGDHWIGDVGQDTYEEVDYQPAGTPGGRNYGWRCYEANTAYNTAGCAAASTMVFPISVYNHNNDCSITGGYIYRGPKYGNLYGWYLDADYCSGTIRGITHVGSTFTTTILNTFLTYQYVAFGEDYRGEMYVSEYTSGKIDKVTEAMCLPTAAIISLNDTINYCNDGNTHTLQSIYSPNNHYQWLINGVVSANDTLSHINVTIDANYSVIVTNSSSCSDTSTAVYTITHPLPTVSFSGLDTLYCINAAPVTLVGSPAGGTYTSTAGIYGNLFYPDSAGSGVYDVTYHYVDQYGCFNNSVLTTIVDVCTGINNYDNFINSNLYPNPNEGMFTLEFYSKDNMQSNLKVTNVMGEIILNQTINTIRGNNRLPIESSSLKAGAYFVKLTSSKGEINKRFVVK